MRFIVLIFLLFTVSCSDVKDTNYDDVIRLSISADPSTIDPRRVNELNPITIVRSIFEGLMRINSQGDVVPGIAESVSISDDMLTYTFKLRDASWSDGSSVTAEDFVYSWKSSLDPAFPSSNAAMLYTIKNGEAVKREQMPLDSLGLRAIDEKTLEVTLEKPTPYFLELTALHFYLPIHRASELANTRWANSNPSRVVSNGPFILDEWKHNNLISIKKNPQYWAADRVQLQGVEFLVLEENTALQMFQKGDLDWAGSPTSIIPPDALQAMISKNTLNSAPSTGTMWLRFNTTKSLLNNPNIRQALSFAVNRKDIVEHITYGLQIPAFGIVPPQLSSNPKGYFSDHQVKKAQELFAKGLEEEGNPKTIPVLRLSYQNDERESKLAQVLQQQWETSLPIKIDLHSVESKFFFSTVRSLNYEIATGSWFADFPDAINFLEVFKNGEVSTNRTKWSNESYTALLEDSTRELNPTKRNHILNQAEEILMNEMPISPLYHFTFNFIKKPEVQGVYLSDMGHLDFSEASKQK